MVRVERAQQILAALRCVAAPQCPKLGDRLVVPIHAQIDQREAFTLHDLQICTPHRSALAAGGEPFLQRVQQPFRERRRRIGLEREQHGGGNARVGKDVADRAGVLPGCLAHLRPDARAAVRCGISFGIQHGELSPMGVLGGCDKCVDRLLRRAAGTQQGDTTWPKTWIGAMLGEHGSDTGRTECDARADCDRGCGDGCTDLACAGAAADE